jgi:hypothetical protein
VTRRFLPVREVCYLYPLRCDLEAAPRPSPRQEVPQAVPRSALPDPPHWLLEVAEAQLTIGNCTYYTGVTFFEPKVGDYTTTM